MMNLENLHNLAANYFKWLDNAEIYVPPELAEYFPNPSLNEEFVAYAAVPTKLFSKREFLEIKRIIGSDVSSAQEGDYAQYLYRVLSARFKNLLNIRLQNGLNLVSIGGNCVPRLLFSKWGLRKTRPLGARSLPFDLVWCEPDGIADIITSEFSVMIDPIYLSTATKKDVRESWKWFVGDVPVVVNNSFSVCYNHEAGSSWIDNRYSRLIDRYRTRIDRFRKIIENGMPTVALMNHQRSFSEKSYDKLIGCAKALARSSKGEMHVVCVVTAGYPNKYTCSRTVDVDERLRLTIAFNPQPPDPYLFYMPSSYGSAAGLAWEAEFLRILEPVINREIGVSISSGIS
ncbi:papain-like cysteine peptidase [Methylobacterium sp. J-072]|uniref:DUF1796 family putative cysteine peptidase n=1 Tax=Methylobacterium sp. J-072 TaxID=2836651 RepID=UPI001FB874BE|nr:DUF1796 family putative cysteine peptidase [Methylobacterium sp. J-072]MCJ2093205.1 papain-like cysteine peptidase [Methylobacterium sp. J-072]